MSYRTAKQGNRLPCIALLIYLMEMCMLETVRPPSHSPARILQTGLAFWPAKTLLSAVELDLFSLLAEEPLTAGQVRDRLSLHGRGLHDFLDALVALEMLTRDEGGRYGNGEEAALFLVRTSPHYAGGMLEMANARLYGFWNNLTEALRTGKPQNEIKGGENIFDAVYRDEGLLENFLGGMTGVSRGSVMRLAESFPWSTYGDLLDIGAAQGDLCVQICRRHGHLRATGLDLRPVEPVFRRHVEANGLGDRITFQAADFFNAPLPQADVITMGHILHDWSLADKKRLIARAYEALRPGGSLIVYDAVIDDERRRNAFALMMSLNMLIETREGFDYTGRDCMGWMQDAGFVNMRVEPLEGPESMVVGVKKPE